MSEWKPIDIPGNATDEGRLIMQGLNQFAALVCERFAHVVTETTCNDRRETCASERKVQAREDKRDSRGGTALVVSIISAGLAVAGFVWGCMH